MEKLSDFLIPYKGLVEGEFQYKMNVNELFFEVYKNPDIVKGELKVELLLIKKSNHLELKFNIDGNVDLVCDRCLEPVEYLIDINENVYVKFGEVFTEVEENFYTLPESEDYINIAIFVDEFLTASIPMRHIHQEDENGNSTCINQLYDYIDNKTKEEEGSIDPRWNELKKLKNGTS